MKILTPLLILCLFLGVLADQQDTVFLAGNLAFAVALVPMLLSKHKPPAESSILTGGILLIYAFAFSTLHLPKSMVGSILTGSMWLVLAGQTIDWKRIGWLLRHGYDF